VRWLAIDVTATAASSTRAAMMPARRDARGCFAKMCGASRIASTSAVGSTISIGATQ
jgi:hypothetical protein